MLSLQRSFRISFHRSLPIPIISFGVSRLNLFSKDIVFFISSLNYIFRLDISSLPIMMSVLFCLIFCFGSNMINSFCRGFNKLFLPRYFNLQLVGCKAAWHLLDKLHTHFHSIVHAKKRQLRNDLTQYFSKQ